MPGIEEKVIIENWDRLQQLARDYFTEDRATKVIDMNEHFGERMATAPASGKEHYHNAFPGGYVDHVLHVIDNSLLLKQMWENSGARIDFSEESLVFCAMHHDLGKVGDVDEDYYIFNESEWHRINQGKIYGFNPKAGYMNVTDRSFYLLQYFDIKYTKEEFIGIRLTDGMYEEANIPYYKAYDPEFQLKSNLAHILHHADMMASRVEYDTWRYENGVDVVTNDTAAVDEGIGKKKEEKKVAEFEELFKKEKK